MTLTRLTKPFCLDVLSEYPDKKSLLMYVMCLFQQLPQAATVLIEDKETNSTCWTNYQKNMERVLQWILKLEEEIDREERVSSNDLKLVKEQFQKHEVRSRSIFYLT